MFADDCCIYSFGKNINETKLKFQNSVDEANKWYVNNNLPVNIPKSMCMLSAPDHFINRLNDEQKELKIKLNNENLNFQTHPTLEFN